MRTLLLSAAIAATLGLPLVARAMPPTTDGTNGIGPGAGGFPTGTGIAPFSGSGSMSGNALGTGMTNDPYRVRSPGNTDVNRSTRGPRDEVDPSSPNSGDTPAAANPRPAP